MFRKARHNTIAALLSMLDSKQLRASKCYFGGGTAMALLNGEYRTSFDVDFLVSDSACYSQLRSQVKHRGILSLFRPEARALIRSSPETVDQYGIRSQIAFLESEIKFEIVREGRIELDTPSAEDEISGVATLSDTDLVTEKLLANSDRHNDPGVFSRDIIDLAFAPIENLLLHPGFRKAEASYGKTIAFDILTAAENLMNSARLERSIAVLEIEASPAQLRKRINALRSPLLGEFDSQR